MKTVIQAALLSSALIATAGFANTTPIHFAKGSYCGSFDGDVVGRKFTMELSPEQTLRLDIHTL